LLVWLLECFICICLVTREPISFEVALKKLILEKNHSIWDEVKIEEWHWLDYTLHYYGNKLSLYYKLRAILFVLLCRSSVHFNLVNVHYMCIVATKWHKHDLLLYKVKFQSYQMNLLLIIKIKWFHIEGKKTISIFGI